MTVTAARAAARRSGTRVSGPGPARAAEQLSHADRAGLPGPFEWDVKRLAASFAVAGRDNGFPAKDRRKIALAARHRVESGLEDKMGAALPSGSAGVVAIYDRSKADTVDATLASAVRKSVAHVDGGGAKKLKAALAEAQAGLGG
jgi:hypothetical protein